MTSKAAIASVSLAIGRWIGRVVRRASSAIAACLKPLVLSQVCQSGCRSSADFACIQLAKPSLSQMLSHHAVVTRSPNHRCAISWERMLKMLRRASAALVAGSNRSRLSKKVMPPQFSMAPPKPPGTAIRSSFGSGYFTPK